jgi:predicted chitinase
MQFISQPQRIANLVYANRDGYGDEKSGEGWNIRSRGFIQLQVKENYSRLFKWYGYWFLNNPGYYLKKQNSFIECFMVLEQVGS